MLILFNTLSHEVAVKLSVGVPSPEALTTGVGGYTYKKAYAYGYRLDVLHHVELSTRLLEHPQHTAAGIPQGE